MSTVESIARPRRNGERRRAPTASISKESDRKSGSAGMPRPISYAVFCLKKKNREASRDDQRLSDSVRAPIMTEKLNLRRVGGSWANFRGRILFFFNDTATTEIYTLSLHDALPILNVTMRDIKSKNVYSRVNSKATTQWRKTESANGVHLEGVASDNRSS